MASATVVRTAAGLSLALAESRRPAGIVAAAAGVSTPGAASLALARPTTLTLALSLLLTDSLALSLALLPLAALLLSPASAD
jgi:hypothetical protein